ncbi:MAG: EAL domain-containing response regulator [Myxococcota bacterium]
MQSTAHALVPDAREDTPCVLLVDDDPALLRSFARCLRRAGFRVVTADSGEAALEAFKATSIDVIVSDISMPRMSGVEMMHGMREADADVPVVLMTGRPSVESAIQAMDSGAMRYLLKPVDPEELASVVSSAVRRRRTAALQRAALQALEEFRPRVEEHDDLERRFQAALDGVFMVYQPIVRWSSRSVHGYETLVRSSEPTIPHPGALFDAAEELDELQKLARVIRGKAPLPMLERHDRGFLFYNLHVRDLHDETLYDPASSLAKMSNRVVLEITERAALDEVKDVAERIARLRELGYRIAVDDLGAGYAGLNSLAELEPDVVKLDMTLVRNVHCTPTKQKLVRSIVALCADMNIEVVAEGVENVEERDCIVELGCDLLQGYFFARPSAPFVDPLL